MSEGRRRDLWDHTASILAMLVNVNLDKKSKPYTPDQFHPFSPKSKPKIESIAALAPMFQTKRKK